MPGPEDLSFDAATALRPTESPGSSRPTSTRCGPWVTSRTAAMCSPSWVGRPATSAQDRTPRGRSCRRRSPTCDRLVRAGTDPDRGATHGTHGRPGSCRTGPGRARPGRRRDGAGRPARRRGALRRRATPAGGQSRAVRPAEPSIPGGTHVGILDILEFRLDPATVPFAQRTDRRLGGRTEGLGPLCRRSGARRPLAPVLTRRLPAGHLLDRLHGLGPDPPDVLLRPGPARPRVARSRA